MIWNIIVNAIVVVLGIFVSMFPAADANITNSIDGQLTPFKTSMATANWLLPVQDLFLIISFVLIIESLIVTIKILHWLFKILTVGFIK